MRKVFTVFFSIVMFILIFLFVISYSSKRIVVNAVTNLYTNEEITNNILEYVYREYPDLTISEKSKLKDKLNRNKEISIITEKYMNGIINSILNDSIEEVDITRELELLIDDVTKDTNYQIREIVKEELKSLNLDEVYLYSINSAKSNFSDEIKFALKTYQIIESKEIKEAIVFAIGICFLFIFLINKSILYSLKVLSIILIVYGVFSSIISFLLDNNIYYLTKFLVGRPISLDISVLSNISLFILIVGIILDLILELINKITKKSNSH